MLRVHMQSTHTARHNRHNETLCNCTWHYFPVGNKLVIRVNISLTKGHMVAHVLTYIAKLGTGKKIPVDESYKDIVSQTHM